MAAAQPAWAKAVTDQQVWLATTVSGSLKGPILFFADLQFRTADGVQAYNQSFVRPAIGVRASRNVSLFAGYHHGHVGVPGGRDRREGRLFGQLSWNMGQLAGGTLTSRWRLERRRLSTGDDTGWRARTMIRYARPFHDPKGVRALGWAEMFVGLNDTDWGQRATLDQVRTFVGLEIPLLGTSTIEPGYLNQTVNGTAGRININHVASVTLQVRL